MLESQKRQVKEYLTSAAGGGDDDGPDSVLSGSSNLLRPPAHHQHPHSAPNQPQQQAQPAGYNNASSAPVNLGLSGEKSIYDDPVPGPSGGGVRNRIPEPEGGGGEESLVAGVGGGAAVADKVGI